MEGVIKHGFLATEGDAIHEVDDEIKLIRTNQPATIAPATGPVEVTPKKTGVRE